MKDPAEGGFPSPATLCGPRQTDYPSLVDPTPPTARSKPPHHQFLSDYPPLAFISPERLPSTDRSRPSRLLGPSHPRAAHSRLPIPPLPLSTPNDYSTRAHPSPERLPQPSPHGPRRAPPFRLSIRPRSDPHRLPGPIQTDLSPSDYPPRPWNIPRQFDNPPQVTPTPDQPTSRVLPSSSRPTYHSWPTTSHSDKPIPPVPLPFNP